MKLDFSVEKTVRARYSVRTFDGRALDEQMKQKLLDYAENINNPLGGDMRIQFVEKTTAKNGEKLGTYGIIKGASQYIAVIIEHKEYSAEALGYAFEQLVLYATSLGLGTCWLGGTFNREAFATNVELREGEVFPILSPVGYPAEKRRVSENLFRGVLGAGSRKPWSELFFMNEFGKPLSEADAGEYAFSLEMMRLAPSAVNKQPWRVVKEGNSFHFFEKSSLARKEAASDMQRIDVGIGVCHFHLAAKERGLRGYFERKPPNIELPKGTDYVVSWVSED